jgi:putative phage-type endonuclease
VSFTVTDSPQRSAEWFRARAGRLTGSRADVLTMQGKGGAESVTRRDYRLQLVCERLTGQPQDDGDGFVNAAMQRGIDMEPLAFGAYEAQTGNMAVRTGFCAMDEYPAGCSLDGHVNAFEGIVEIKCPKSATHLRYLRDGVIPKDYVPQITHNLWVTGAAWCDFLSYDDRFPADLQVFCLRVLAKDLDLASHQIAALKFLNEVDLEVNAIRSMQR